MFRIPALMNSMRCAAMASNAGLKQGSRFVRPMSISAARFTEDTATKEDQNIESLFNGEPSSRPQTETQQQFRRGNRTMAWLVFFNKNVKYLFFSINRIELLGGVADSPSERTTRNGNNYLTFNMFTNVEFRKPDGTTDENVELHNVIVFGNLINYSRKNIQKGILIGKIIE